MNITQNTRARSTRGKIQYKIPVRVPNAEKYSTKYQSAFHTQKNITQNTSARSTHRKYITQSTRACSTCGKYLTQNNRARSTCGKIQHKIPERIPRTENVTKNTGARSIRGKIQHKISERIPRAEEYKTSFLIFFLYSPHTTQVRIISYNTTIKHKNATCIQHLNTARIQYEIHAARKIQPKVGVLGAD